MHLAGTGTDRARLGRALSLAGPPRAEQICAAVKERINDSPRCCNWVRVLRLVVYLVSRESSEVALTSKSDGIIYYRLHERHVEVI